MKIHIKSVFVRVAFDSMLLSIICKMLYQINQNNVFRMFGYGLQMLVLACCVVQELITFKRKSFDFTVAIFWYREASFLLRDKSEAVSFYI